MKIDGISVGKRYVYSNGKIIEPKIVTETRLSVVQVDFTPEPPTGRVRIYSLVEPERTPWMDWTEQTIHYQPGIGWRHFLLELDADRGWYDWTIRIDSPDGGSLGQVLHFQIRYGEDSDGETVG